jgi:integrase/recombinase XerD
MSRQDVFRMIKRRCQQAELGAAANCHTFRATGITAYLLNGGTLEHAQATGVSTARIPTLRS